MNMCGLETQIDRFDRLHIGHVKIFDKFIKKKLLNTLGEKSMEKH